MKEVSVWSRLDAWNSELRVYPGNVKQRLGLHVENRGVFGWVRDLENPLEAVICAQSEVLIPLTVQRGCGRLNVKGLLGDFGGLLGRKRRCSVNS